MANEELKKRITIRLKPSMIEDLEYFSKRTRRTKNMIIEMGLELIFKDMDRETSNYK